MTADKREDLTVRLLAAHGSHYDITRNYHLANRIFPGYAEFHSFGEQYVLVKRAKLWEVNTHEFLFIDFADNFNETALEDAVAFMKKEAFKKVPAGPNHMSSALTLVILANSATDKAVQLLRKTRFRKSYKLSFQGWADLRLALVDFSRPNGKQVFTNTAGKQLKQTIEQNLQLIVND